MFKYACVSLLGVFAVIASPVPAQRNVSRSRHLRLSGNEPTHVEGNVQPTKNIRYTLIASEPGELRIHSIKTEFPIEIRMYSSDGSPLTSFTYEGHRGAAELQRAGHYVMEVENTGSSRGGHFTLSIDFTRLIRFSENEQKLIRGNVAAGRLIRYTITVKEAGTLLIDDMKIGFRIQLRLYDSDSRSLASLDDHKLEAQLVRPGDYVLHIQNAGPSSGHFGFRISFLIKS